MKKKEIMSSRFKVSKSVIVITFFLFVVVILRMSYLCLVDYKVGDTTIEAFIKKRNTKEEVIMPKRGTIYDVNGNILASDVASYTLIAYLSHDRVDAKGNKDYIEDIEGTSNALAKVLDVSSKDIESIILNGIRNDKYQVEFGKIGKGISELTKEKIDKLSLQGIDFTRDIKRYYPNGDFASYLLGYTKTKMDENKHNWIKGEMGLEEYFNEELKGTEGYITYEKDRYGYKIANGREYVKPAQDGSDIYLTIDDNIQLFIEKVVKEAQEKSSAEWVMMAAMDAKTGKILGYSGTPSFDPNIRNMTSYIDPLVTLTYEPGSTMKVFSYMCAIDSGRYNGNTLYESGTKQYKSDLNDKIVTISDWNKKGWGKISYDEGFALSSNIAVANLLDNVINKNELKACFDNYGFGKPTGFTLKREEKGSINYKYQIEAAIAGYGQGITTTPIQHLQGLSIIANDGEMIKPYVVDKIVDSSGNTIFNGKREVINKVVKKDTVEKMKELMSSVINGNEGHATGRAYYMDGYDLIGKTGTAQIFDYKKGHYLDGASDYIYSFSGIFPKDNPKVIIYTAIKKPKDTKNYLAPMVKEVEENITKYLNIENKPINKTNYKVESYYNKDSNNVKKYLSAKGINALVLGDNGKVVNQYPSIGSDITSGDLVILRTDKKIDKMIDLKGYSKKEAINILRLMNIDYSIEGTGYVYDQSIKPGEVINGKITIKLKDKF